MIVQGDALVGVVTAKQAIYNVSCILECGQSLMHLRNSITCIYAVKNVVFLLNWHVTVHEGVGA